MMKYILFFVLFISSFNSFCQQQIFRGEYKSGGKTKESAVQFLHIYYGEKSEILFYLEASRGAPSYNSGSIYGRLIIDSRKDHLQYIPEDTAADCTLEFIKKGNKILVKTTHGKCQFGYGVDADGDYSLVSGTNPLYFTDRHGKRIYFSKTAPENYFR